MRVSLHLFKSLFDKRFAACRIVRESGRLTRTFAFINNNSFYYMLDNLMGELQEKKLYNHLIEIKTSTHAVQIWHIYIY